ncbi:unnamed protein product [Thlaspi arvense]|uniref:Pentatricopeptide repeat-containing protein n=1 Tax=Thlaspi arvense TaxID=13288 RepID=A0AAU9SQR3_THLAR|nr:unnamed protein product [Thlaspi arvense]
MNKEGLKLDAFIVPSLLKATRNLIDQEFGKVMHCLVLKCSFESDAFIVSSLIDMYSKFGEVENARKVFDDFAGQDLVVFNAMVSGFANNSQADEALSLVQDMKLVGIKADIITWNALIAGFSHMGNEEKVSETLEMMCLDGHKPDVVTWTSVISGLVHNFQYEKAFDAFKQMLAHGLYPNSATITTLLPACTTLANVKHGKEIHGYSVVTGLEDHGFVRSALLDMYGKCGFISEAMILFRKTPKKTTVTFNSMIFCYANHGLVSSLSRKGKDKDTFIRKGQIQPSFPHGPRGCACAGPSTQLKKVVFPNFKFSLLCPCADTSHVSIYHPDSDQI